MVVFLFLFDGAGIQSQDRAGALPLEPLHQPFFVLSIFNIGSHELFAWAAFELQSC
jgi:hypothetical protein